MRLVPFIVIYFLFMRSYGQAQRVVYLENDVLKVGVLLGTGGRIVYFGLKENGNILKADTSLWDEPETEKPAMEEVNNYKAYHGNVVWPSPMSQWWTNQDIYPGKRDRADRWPPDPYLIYSQYQIVEQDEKSLTWQSPESPVSGIQITEKVELTGDNAMIFKVEFKNITDSVIQWGIWLNNRLDGKDRCFVKVVSPDAVKIKDRAKLKTIIPWKVENGFFTFFPEQVEMKNEKVYTKACIEPEIPLIAAFTDKQMIIIKTPGVDPANVHPQQSFIEIFNQVLPDGRDDLLELEFHAEYQEIRPGETIKVLQEWSIFPCIGLNTDAQRIAFLESKIHEYGKKN